MFKISIAAIDLDWALDYQEFMGKTALPARDDAENIVIATQRQFMPISSRVAMGARKILVTPSHALVRAYIAAFAPLRCAA